MCCVQVVILDILYVLNFLFSMYVSWLTIVREIDRERQKKDPITKHLFWYILSYK